MPNSGLTNARWKQGTKTNGNGNSDRVGCDLGKGVLSSPQSGSRAGANAIEATRICHQ